MEAAAKDAASGGGKEMMDSIRVQVGRMQNEERRLLKIRDSKSKSAAQTMFFIIELGSVLALVIVGSFGFFIRREIRRHGLAEETYTVEGYNILFRHFLARLRRKTMAPLAPLSNC